MKTKLISLRCSLQTKMSDKYYKFQERLKIEQDLIKELPDENLLKKTKNYCNLKKQWQKLQLKKIEQAINKHKEIPIHLLRKMADLGYDFTSKDIDRDPLIFDAAYANNVTLVEFLINQGADINEESISGQTLLMVAITAGNEDIVKLLIKHKVDVNKISSFHESPLIVAAETNQYRALQLLLDNGADKNYEHPYYGSALTKAIENGAFEATEYLLEQGALKAPNSKIKRSSLETAILSGQTNIINLLIKHGNSVHEINYWQESMLMVAVQSQNLETIKKFISLGIDLNHKDSNGETALMHAIRSEKREIAREILNAGALVHPTNNSGDTALSLACYYGRHDVIEILFEKSIKDNFFNKDLLYKTAIGKYRKIYVEEYMKITDLLIKNGLNPKDNNSFTQEPIWCMAVREGNLGFIQALVEFGHLDINTQNQRGHTMLMIAKFFRHHDIIKYLAEKDAETLLP